MFKRKILSKAVLRYIYLVGVERHLLSLEVRRPLTLL